MPGLSDREKIQILMMVGYGDRKRTQLEVCNLFNELYPNRNPITQSCVSKLIRRFNDTGSIKNLPRTGRPKVATDGYKALNVLLDIAENPKQSTRRLGLQHDISHMSVDNLLRKQKMRPYKVHLVQELNEDDFDRRSQFCENLMERCNIDPLFANKILFSDEATFMLNGSVNRHNCRFWSSNNPRWMEEVHTQRPEKLNVWIGIIDQNVIGPFFIEGNLTSERYLLLLQENVIPSLNALYPNREEIWFQQDGAPAHFSVEVRQFLDEEFPNRWIGRRGEIEWPARSPDLTPLDFFLWGHLKTKVYESKPLDLNDLRNRIVGESRFIPAEVFSNVIQEFRDRLGYCLANNGAHFEHLL